MNPKDDDDDEDEYDEEEYDEEEEEYDDDNEEEYDEKIPASIMMEWFLSQQPINIRNLAKKYFDYDLEAAWKFIEAYDLKKSVDDYEAEDYDEVYEEIGYDEDDEDYQNEKATRLDKKNQNNVILVNTIYDTPADKGGLELDRLDKNSMHDLYKFLGGKKRRKTNKKGKSKSKKSQKKGKNKSKKSQKKGKIKSKKSQKKRVMQKQFLKNTRKYVKKGR